ncbi:MAG: DNA-directed RNA polymerase subunit K [Nitrososphaerota archaeon]|nr:DNA-directed RNA polymerase subunit K [Nitrososphaerales archaeon]MDW8044751.1 DNA-directed RNA polymerase subunit K [Nitrososphaerota archaeon]
MNKTLNLKEESIVESNLKREGRDMETVQEFQVKIGPKKLTRFERARIIGARALQLALGAPPFIPIPPHIKDPISLAIAELESRALPISIRRTLPDGTYQDIPIDVLL